MKKISNQLAWQKRKQKQRLCAACGRNPLAKGSKRRCESCLLKNRKLQRAMFNWKPWQPGGMGRPPLNLASV